MPEPPIDGDIEDDHDCAQLHLKASCQVLRVEGRQQILCDEVGVIRSLAILLAQPIFQRRERADPAGEFNDCAPHGSGQVEPCDPSPLQCKQPAAQDEDYERQVNNQSQIG